MEQRPEDREIYEQIIKSDKLILTDGMRIIPPDIALNRSQTDDR